MVQLHQLNLIESIGAYRALIFVREIKALVLCLEPGLCESPSLSCTSRAMLFENIDAQGARLCTFFVECFLWFGLKKNPWNSVSDQLFCFPNVFFNVPFSVGSAWVVAVTMPIGFRFSDGSVHPDRPAAKESGQSRSAFIIKDNSSVVTLDLKFTLLTLSLAYSLSPIAPRKPSILVSNLLIIL